MDEAAPSGESLPFDDYLEPMIQEAADEITDTAPKHLLTPSALSGTILYENDLAYIPVNTNFARLYAIKLPLWERTVWEALVPDDPDFGIQDNTYVKAGYARPAVRLQSAMPTGASAIGKYLVCGKVADGATPDLARCIEYKTAANMPTDLDEALTWLAASKILGILGEGELSV